LPGRWGQQRLPYAPTHNIFNPEEGLSSDPPLPHSLGIEVIVDDLVPKKPAKTAVVSIMAPGEIEEPEEKTEAELEDDPEDEEEGGLVKVPVVTVAELNVAKFDEVFSTRAPEGTITADRMSSLLVSAGAPGTDAEILIVVKRVLGWDYKALDLVDYEKALEMYRRLMLPQEDSTDLMLGEVKKMGRLERWAASLSDSRATNVLLSIVTGVSFVAAFLVVGLAILFMWIDSFKVQEAHMLDDLGTMRDMMDVFDQEIYVGEVQSRALEIVTLVAMGMDYISLQAVLGTDLNNLVYMATFMGQGVAAWWGYQPSQAYINIAKVTAIWTDQMVVAEGRTDAVTAVNSVVNLLPSGYELLLGQWTNASNVSFQYLSTPRYTSQCLNETCNFDTHGTTFSPMIAALQGQEGAIEILDYRPHMTFVGYTSIDGIGVEYKTDIENIDNAKYIRTTSFFNLQNAVATDSKQFLLGQIDANGNYMLLSNLSNCNAACMSYTLRPDGPMGLALQRQVGSMETTDAFGNALMAAYTPIPSTGLGLVVQMLKSDRLAAILASVAGILNTINANMLNGTEEIELVVLNKSTGQLTHMTKYKFGSECPPSGCANLTEYWSIPMKNCSSGSVRTTDYRGVAVYAGYYCVPDFNAFLAMKVDDTQVNQDMMSYVLQLINQRNQKDMGTSYEFLAAQAKGGLVGSEVQSFADVELLSKIKYPNTCLEVNCTWDSHALLRALQDKPGDLPATMDDINYAGKLVITALDFDPTVGGGVGLVLSQNYSDFVAPIMNVVMILLCFALGTCVFATAVLVVLTKRMMRSMITASLEGKGAIEKEKEQFSSLVASMYPKYVVPRLLAGERHIVGHVKHTAVFFSDIYEFTAASNTITSEELLQFMGYTYGVMDHIADRYGVYKVKTVGDAYLAIAGLPGIEPGSGSAECCLDMLKFASCVAQIFSHRFNHPSKGDIMTVVAGTMPWNKKRGKGGSSKHSGSEIQSRNKVGAAPTNSAMESASAWTGKNTMEAESVQRSAAGSSKRGGPGTTVAAAAKAPHVACIMSYGIAAGPVTAGVLQGKSPMFDIWGKTVNLASRMETTGQPGRIQVSEHVFRRVVAVPDQPFAFEHGHKAYCKGFGAVTSYFVRCSSEPPPKALMIQLGLEPRYGLFYFDNVLNNAMQRADANYAGAAPASSVHRSVAGEDVRSQTSSHSKGPSKPYLANPTNPVLDVLEFDD
jgi:class 3 adenylate cyclase